MLRYQIHIDKKAARMLAILHTSQPSLAIRIAQAIDRLADAPDRGVPLRGELQGVRKVRVGAYRILYQIVRHQLLIVVVDIDHRKQVYR